MYKTAKISVPTSLNHQKKRKFLFEKLKFMFEKIKKVKIHV